MRKTRSDLRSCIVPFFICIACLVASCVPQPVPSENIPGKRSRPSINLSELERQIHALINKERRNHGLSSLSWNDTLSTIARKHSRDMSKRNYFSHDSLEGHDFTYRYRQEGFSCSIPEKNVVYGGAENIFQNNLYDRVVYVNREARYDWNTIKQIAESTVKGWMHSPGHRKNILAPHWRSEGIGVALSPDDKVYITQNFC